MRGHAPPCRLLGRSAFKLRLPSIHRTAERDCLKSPFRLQTKALRVNNGRGVAPERTPPISSYKTLRASLPDGQSYPDRTGTGRAFSSHKRDKTSTRTKQRRCATRPLRPFPFTRYRIGIHNGAELTSLFSSAPKKGRGICERFIKWFSSRGKAKGSKKIREVRASACRPAGSRASRRRERGSLLGVWDRRTGAKDLRRGPPGVARHHR
jgi:hypothetical protein